MSDYIMKADSWTIINDNTFVKQGDKSFFEFQTTGVPKIIKKYWKADKLVHGDHLVLSFSFAGKSYEARIDIDPMDRAKISWKSDLGAVFKRYYDQEKDFYPQVRFQRINTNEYIITVDGKELVNGYELSSEESDWYEDGKKTQITTFQRERNRKNREAAIRIHGYRCMICKFDFEEKYGEAGREYIEVHHLHPLSEQDDAMKIDPEKDLICVCSNCHRVIHRKKKGVYTPEEVKEMIANNDKNR